MFEDILTTYGYLGIFLVTLAVNLLPFTSPSNMVLAGAVTFLLPKMNPFLVGLSVALAASMAKTGHYCVASYLSRKGGSKTEKLELYGRSLGKWGALAAFVVAATPIPDDPVVIPLGLTQYSPSKFFVAYFLGKALISVGGAYLGQSAAAAFEKLFPTNEYIAITAVLSVIIVAVLVKVDLQAIASKLKKAVIKS